MLQKKALWRGLTFLFAFLLCFCITAAIILEQFSGNVDDFLGTQSTILTSDDDGSLYSVFTPDDAYVTKDSYGNITGGVSKNIIQAAIDLGEQEGAEGTVLLKNTGVLPLASGSSVTLLGTRSHTPLLGSGMGVKVQGPMITLEDALQRTTTDWTNAEKWDSGSVGSEMDVFSFKGAGYKLNQDAIDFYSAYNTGYSYNDAVSKGTNIVEASKSELQSALGTCSGYTDGVIVVIGRNGSESTDYLKGTVTAGLGNDEPLALTTNEKETIEYAKEVTGNNGKVIILINSCNAIEMDEYKTDDGIGAILNISFPGAYGMLGVADVLCGTTSPSGGLADIQAANNLSAPAMQNMGDYTFTNSDEITRSYSKNYIMEAENIYTGYRYYETRYEDTVLGQGNASSSTGTYMGESAWDYDKEVTYGFGYGLTYTSFTQEIEKVEETSSSHSITLTFTVKVTNTGSVAGKSNVQIYGQAPYTKGGLEKTAIELLAYDKTDELKAGASQELTITADLQNLASYDSTLDRGDGELGGYVMDAGDYYFAVGNGAHDALNNVLVAKGYAGKIDDTTKSADGIDSLVYTWNYNPAGGKDVDTFSVSKSGVRITNQIPYADINYYNAGTVTYLSRAAWDTTYPEEDIALTATTEMMDDLNATGGNYYQPKTADSTDKDDTSSFVWGSTDTTWQFYQMVLADWDDYRWDELLSEMTINESMYMAAWGGPTFASAESIGFSEMQLTENNGNGIVYTFAGSKDTASPWAISTSDKNSGWNGQVFGASPLLAATFNPEIALRRGEFVGNESLFLGVPIIWGPGLNTHRQAYNGRNCEYYSEDPILCGVVAEYFSYGCGEYGLIASPKHFAFNDQETNRQGVAPFMTEQRAREIELRAYQISIECPDMDTIEALAANPNQYYQGMYGVMTSFSKIGAVECTCSRGLLTGILRDEWGFHGYTVTDIFDDMDLYNCTVYAGITGYDCRGAQNFNTAGPLSAQSRFADGSQVNSLSLNEDAYKYDATMMESLKINNKNLLWAFAQSNLMNRYNSTTHSESVMTWWRVAYIVAIVVVAVITAAFAVLYVLSFIFKKKEA